MNALPLILPQPQRVFPGGEPWVFRMRGHRSVDWSLKVTHSPGLAGAAALLAGYLETENHVPVDVSEGGGGAIHLAQGLESRPVPSALAVAGFGDERHRLEASAERISIEAVNADGAVRAIQTLRQLLSGQRARLLVPGLVIEDEPALGWRGLHLDVARHFFSAPDVKRFVDLAALHKFNLFHWHLTDDQGWRLPVPGYPNLEKVAAWRDGTLVGHDGDRDRNATDGVRHGGIYSEEEIREVVAYAAARGVRVLPEVDVPGHVQALVTAYPEFGNTGKAPGVRTCWGIGDTTLNLEPETLGFLGAVVDTLTRLFPFHYLHFGGDEAKPGEWAASARVQARKAELGLHDDQDVQSFFTRWLHRESAARGRAMIGWDEIIEHDGQPQETAVMFWRDSEKEDRELDKKALRGGHPLVLANWSRTYFDLYQEAGPGMGFEPLAIGGSLPIEHVYDWRLLERLSGEPIASLLGGQAQVWTEYIPTRRHLDYMVYPRACALAQVLWTGERREGWPAFADRLAAHLPRLDRLGVAYRPSEPRP